MNDSKKYLVRTKSAECGRNSLRIEAHYHEGQIFTTNVISVNVLDSMKVQFITDEIIPYEPGKKPVLYFFHNDNDIGCSVYKWHTTDRGIVETSFIRLVSKLKELGYDL